MHLLSSQQRTVLALVVLGLTNKQIALYLGASLSATKNTLRRASRKLGISADQCACSSRIKIVRLLLAQGG